MLAAIPALVVFNLCFPWPGPCTYLYGAPQVTAGWIWSAWKHAGGTGSTLTPESSSEAEITGLCLESSGLDRVPDRDAEPRQALGKGTLLSWNKLLSHCSRLGHFCSQGPREGPVLAEAPGF